jgi:hypothetical protein
VALLSKFVVSDVGDGYGGLLQVPLIVPVCGVLRVPLIVSAY